MINPDDFEDILDTLEDEDRREEWEDEWVCQQCEYGPMHGDLDKCDRCGCKKDKKFKEYDDFEDDGWGEEKEIVEEIY